ncbi:MAG: nitroreductase family protein [Bdellovibrionales bacterium]|nr:nitroreductase family protein [Bdellovibrionales bacterium]
MIGILTPLNFYNLEAPFVVSILCLPLVHKSTTGQTYTLDHNVRISIQEATVASAFMVLQAEMMGVSCCYVQSFRQKDMQKALKLITDDSYILCNIAFGYSRDPIEGGGGPCLTGSTNHICSMNH